MIRLLAGIVLSFVSCMTAISQPNMGFASGQETDSPQRVDDRINGPETLQRIELYEAAARSQAKLSIASRVKIYAGLGILYQDAGMSLKAEDAIQRAIALLKEGPQDQLAEEVEQLAVLHVAMGKMRQAEHDEMHDMQIRKAVANPVGIALAESSLASLYDEERKFAKALNYAEKAYDVLADRTDVDAADQIGLRQTLGVALTGMRSCDRGVELLKDGLQLARSSPGVGKLKVAYAEFTLGFGYWHCGDRSHAEEWLQRGTTDMKADYGWDHAMYVNAMKQYARFLRQNGEQEAAISAEAVVNQAQSVVDAGAFTGRSEGFRSAGSK
jgi:tetratricopeptide (TPR) repeat protein